MTLDQIIQDLMKKIIELPDLTGMSRCAGFYMMYQGILLLKQKTAEEAEKHKDEVLVLQARIRDLEAKLKEKE